MLALSLFSLIGFGAILAVASMIDTWQQHGSAWQALDAEMRGDQPAPIRYVTVRVGRGQPGAMLVQECRAGRGAIRRQPGSHAAA